MVISATALKLGSGPVLGTSFGAQRVRGPGHAATCSRRPARGLPGRPARTMRAANKSRLLLRVRKPLHSVLLGRVEGTVAPVALTT